MDLRWGDLDAVGHLNNTIYFRFFEQIRAEWLLELFRKVGHSCDGPIIIKTNCTFFLPVMFPERVIIHLDAGPAGRSSFETYYEVRSAGNPATLYAEGGAKIVWANRETGRSTPIPDDVRAQLPTG